MFIKNVVIDDLLDTTINLVKENKIKTFFIFSLKSFLIKKYENKTFNYK